MRNYDVVLTDPDIFHYIMQLFYRREGKYAVTRRTASLDRCFGATSSSHSTSFTSLRRPKWSASSMLYCLSTN